MDDPTDLSLNYLLTILVKVKLKTPLQYILVNVLYNNDKSLIASFKLVIGETSV